MEVFPAFLLLGRRKVLVVGGGDQAAAKIDALRRAGARVTVVSPVVGPSIERAVLAGVTVIRRRVRAADLDGAWFVVAASTPAVNRLVARAAARRRIFVNAVDDPANATVYLGGVLRRQGVTVAISTGGRAPALAGLLREAIDAILPADLPRWMRRADGLRRRWRRSRTPLESRRRELAGAIAALYPGVPRPRARGRAS